MKSTPAIVIRRENKCEAVTFSFKNTRPRTAVVITVVLKRVSTSLISRYFKETMPKKTLHAPEKPRTTKAVLLPFGPNQSAPLQNIKKATKIVWITYLMARRL